MKAVTWVRAKTNTKSKNSSRGVTVAFSPTASMRTARGLTIKSSKSNRRWLHQHRIHPGTEFLPTPTFNQYRHDAQSASVTGVRSMDYGHNVLADGSNRAH